MWASEARLITLLGADSFNLSSRRFVNKKWPGGRQKLLESGSDGVRESILECKGHFHLFSYRELEKNCLFFKYLSG